MNVKWFARVVAIAAAAALMSLAAVGCTASPGHGASSAPARAAGDQTAPAGFAGYKWQVTAITHGGKPTPIPANDDVYLEFTPNGQFLGNEPINDHFGTYRQVGDGFTTGELITSAVGYAGGNPVIELARTAITAFDGGVHAGTTVSGDRMTVSVGGYLLDCQRDGKQRDFAPAPPT